MNRHAGALQPALPPARPRIATSFTRVRAHVRDRACVGEQPIIDMLGIIQHKPPRVHAPHAWRANDRACVRTTGRVAAPVVPAVIQQSRVQSDLCASVSLHTVCTGPGTRVMRRNLTLPGARATAPRYNVIQDASPGAAHHQIPILRYVTDCSPGARAPPVTRQHR